MFDSFLLSPFQVSDLKSHAIMIAAPFSLTLGLLGSIFAIILGMCIPETNYTLLSSRNLRLIHVFVQHPENTYGHIQHFSSHLLSYSFISFIPW